MQAAVITGVLAPLMLLVLPPGALPWTVVALPVLAYVVIIGLLWRYPISRDSPRQMREIIEEREDISRQEATGAL